MEKNVPSYIYTHNNEAWTMINTQEWNFVVIVTSSLKMLAQLFREKSKENAKLFGEE